MDKFEEKQTDLMSYLNDIEVEPTPTILSIAEIFDVEFIKETGWWLKEE